MLSVLSKAVLIWVMVVSMNQSQRVCKKEQQIIPIVVRVHLQMPQKVW